MDLVSLNILIWCCFVAIYVSDIKAQSNKCGKFEWTCQNKDCIPVNKYCDGEKDCGDGSDETVDGCSANVCNRNSFQCNYGACVDSRAKCNGFQDCVDNSDEMASTCWGVNNKGNGIMLSQHGGNLSIQWSQPSVLVLNAAQIIDVLNALRGTDVRPEGYTPTPPTVPKTPSTSSAPRGGCRIESFPNGIITLQSNSTELMPGMLVAGYSHINYKCLGRYELEGQNINLCEGTMWSFKSPKCVIYCITELIKGITIALKHALSSTVPTYGGYKESVGTLVNISCAEGYVRPKGDFPEQLVCKENGEWDRFPKRCEQTCGILSKSEYTKNNTILLAPWHIAIYQKTETTWYEEVCGGTILSATLVISVAHCFWNSETSMLVDLNNVAMVVGKYYSGYFQGVDESSSYLTPSEIYIPQTYKDKQEDDVALLPIKYPFPLSKNFLPICMDLDNGEDRHLEINTIGRIAGRGTKSNCSTFHLVDVPTINCATCFPNTDAMTERRFTTESIFAGELNDLCVRDGGGFAVPRYVDGQKTYFLEGIITSGIRNDKYVAINPIHKYSTIIKEYLTRTTRL